MRTNIKIRISPQSAIRNPQSCGGFTLVEMIVVMAITGILGAIVALIIRTPVQEYMDSARRAEMSDIADTASQRLARDIRTALPNSVRVTPVGASYYLEYIPTTGGGRYRSNATGGVGNCGGAGDDLSIGAADTCFEVLGSMPNFAPGDRVVVNNTAANSAYNASNWTPYSSKTPPAVFITSFTFPSASPEGRFQVISTPVTYVCSPVAGGAGGTLTRYWGYAIQAAQPVNIAAAPLSAATHALLATNVGACSFSLPQAELAAMQLTISESGESISLYQEIHVGNKP